MTESFHVSLLPFISWQRHSQRRHQYAARSEPDLHLTGGQAGASRFEIIGIRKTRGLWVVDRLQHHFHLLGDDRASPLIPCGHWNALDGYQVISGKSNTAV